MNVDNISRMRHDRFELSTFIVFQELALIG